MPVVPFESLPDTARIWVFGANAPIQGAAEEMMMGEVDRFLADWKAHGAPLTVGRKWEDCRFLIVGVDQSEANASGCSIDGLFRTLQGLESQIRATMVDRGLIFYREPSGDIKSTSREEFLQMATSGAITGATDVFDPTVTTMGEWRSRFRSKAADSWHANLLNAHSA